MDGSVVRVSSCGSPNWWVDARGKGGRRGIGSHSLSMPMSCLVFFSGIISVAALCLRLCSVVLFSAIAAA
jgi:hypothetical protein